MTNTQWHKHLLAWRAITISPPEAQVNKYRDRDKTCEYMNNKDMETAL